MFTDPIGDMLTRIRNGYLARNNEVEIPLSGVKKAIADVLSREGLVGKVDITGEKNNFIKVVLKYDRQKPALTAIKRVSKPGSRVFVGYKNLPRVLGGLGFAIVSTPSGIMTNKEAAGKKSGGEIICIAW